MYEWLGRGGTPWIKMPSAPLYNGPSLRSAASFSESSMIKPSGRTTTTSSGSRSRLVRATAPLHPTKEPTTTTTNTNDGSLAPVPPASAVGSSGPSQDTAASAPGSEAPSRQKHQGIQIYYIHTPRSSREMQGYICNFILCRNKCAI